ILFAVPYLRLRVCYGNLHRLGVAGRDYLQTVQRLARRGAPRQLLLLRAFSLPPNAYDLEATGPVAIPTRGRRLEAHEAQRALLGASPVKSLLRPASGQESATGLQIRQQTIHFGVAVETRQAVADIVGEELDFGAGDG